MLIAYIHAYSSPVIETIYHVVNIISTETELFTIRCSINQATHLLNTRRIVIISDFIYMAKRIKDSSSYLYQIHLAAIFCEFRKFFKRNIDNFIEFWDCPSHCNWGLHLIVDKETKSFNPIPIFPCKFSQDFSRKNEYDSILNTQKMYFQVSDDKGCNFLNLCDEISLIFVIMTCKLSLY